MAIQVSEMELYEATKLLLLSIQPTCQDETTEVLASRLATKLGNLPLAIDQAAAYINYRQMSMDEYLFLLEEEQAYLLGHSSSNRYHKKTQLEGGQYDTVLTTWEIYFRHIRKTHLHASLLCNFYLPTGLIIRLIQLHTKCLTWQDTLLNIPKVTFGIVSGERLLAPEKYRHAVPCLKRR